MTKPARSPKRPRSPVVGTSRLIPEPKPIELARTPELTARIILRQLQVDPHCRMCLKPLNPRYAELLDFDGKFPDVVCRTCRTSALEGGGQ